MQVEGYTTSELLRKVKSLIGKEIIVKRKVKSEEEARDTAAKSLKTLLEL